MDAKFILDWSMVLSMLILLVDGAVSLWAALFRLEQIEDALGNCQIIIDSRRQRQNLGLQGRQWRYSTATGALLFTKMYARKGLVDPDDVKNMPIHLKRWAIIPNVTGAVLLLVMFVQLLLAGKIL